MYVYLLLYPVRKLVVCLASNFNYHPGEVVLACCGVRKDADAQTGTPPKNEVKKFTAGDFT